MAEHDSEHGHWGNVTPLKKPPKRLSGHVRRPRASDAQVREWAASIRETLGWDQPQHDDSDNEET